MAVSFDLYGTLVRAERPPEPWTAVADALAERGVSVPPDWETAYRTSHVETDPLRESSLVEHTRAALASRGVEAKPTLVGASLVDAFDVPVTVRPGADRALRTAADAGPVGLLSNCSVPGLVARTLDRAALPVDFDAVVTSLDCGFRKPHDRAFAAVADALGVDPSTLVHVGDDPRTDGGGRTAGVTVYVTAEMPLTDLSDELGAGR